MAISGAIDGVVGARGVCDDILETAYGTGVKSIDFDDGFKGFDLSKDFDNLNYNKSFADFMSPEDAARYDEWIRLREAGLDQQVVNDILLTNKGYRPDPTTYLSKEYIDAHLKMFSDGVTKINKAPPSGQAGPPGGTFVMPKSVADEIIQEANGDVSKLEKLLSLEPGTLGDNPVRLDVEEPNGLRMSSGNELGANEQWIPGGTTGGGIPEATIDSPLPGEYISTPIFE